jgi:hypothetical protein
MNSSLASIMLVSSLFAIACCILSLFDHFKKGEILYRLWK